MSFRRALVVAFVAVVAACDGGNGADTAPPETSASKASSPLPPVEWKPELYSEATQKLELSAGNDPRQFFMEFRGRINSTAKGEFETTAQYEERMQHVEELLSPFSLEEKYAFRLNGRMSYDADNGAFKSYSGEWCSESYPFDDHVACQVGSFTKTRTTGVGQNSYGATAEVETETGEDYYLLFASGGNSAKAMRRTAHSFAVPVNCEVPLEKAKAVKEVGALLVGRIKKADVEHGDSRIEDATVRSPRGAYFRTYGIPFEMTEIVCYAIGTGEVLDVKSY